MIFCMLSTMIGLFEKKKMKCMKRAKRKKTKTASCGMESF